MAEKPVVWRANPGAQALFLSCPFTEVLIHGTRGGGKTDVALMDFARHVGQGFGQAWRGIYFRRHYGDLERAVQSANDWFPKIWGKRFRFNWADYYGEWDTGEVLLFRAIENKRKAGDYQGHEYPWIHWEEITEWASKDCYDLLRATNRTGKKGLPRRISASTNPSGVGHSWNKRYWIDVAPDRVPYTDPNTGITRVAIWSSYNDNPHLLEASPDYIANLKAISDPNKKKAWLEGSWDIVSGGMFDDVWDPAVHIVKPFRIPSTWKLTRSFDWGSASPFSVGWWAISDGSDVRGADGRWRSTVRGDRFRALEWYGAVEGKENEGLKLLNAEISEGIVEREVAQGWRHGSDCIVKPGPADSSIFDNNGGNCIATDMAKRVRLKTGMEYPGIQWEPADKRPGSRKNGWQVVREALLDAKPPKHGGIREKPGLFVFDHCKDFRRLFPIAPRSDKDPEDIDTEAEDHILDEVRYFVASASRIVTIGQTSGAH